MAYTLDEDDWDNLLYYIEKGRCTPFLGAGAAYGALPLGGDVARKWAAKYGYPFADIDNLPRVAQYVAVTKKNFLRPKDLLVDEIKASPGPNFDEPSEPHSVLASLPLPIYITTNYDDYMSRALIRSGCNPISVVCPWTSTLQKQLSPSVFEKGYDPTPDNPVVFHLHGQKDLPVSMVLTEDDYVDFLVHITEHFHKVIPARIGEAFSDSVILFLGYSLADWDFRILFRALSETQKSHKKTQVSVQLLPGTQQLTDEQKQHVQDYLDKYYAHLEIKVHWGTCREFMGELKRRWKAYNNG